MVKHCTICILGLLLVGCGGSDGPSNSDVTGDIVGGDTWSSQSDTTTSTTDATTTSARADTTNTPGDTTQVSLPDSNKPDPDTNGPGPGNSSFVDPGCIDGQYDEPLPTPDVDISGEIAAFTPGQQGLFALSVLDKRYPVGAYLVQGGWDNTSMGDCVDWIIGNKTSGQEVIDSMGTLVHECGHFFNIGLSGFSGSKYVITKDLMISCTGGNKFEYGGKTFPRDELMNDDYADVYPACAPGEFGGDCDFYAQTYLTGQSGDQGFNMLFEEFVQYVNSLATGYAFNDFHKWGSSTRDGALTFMWYIQRYLYLARTQYPETYTFLANDTCWRDAILTVWGRSALYLEVTKDYTALGLADDKIQALVEDPALLKEIADLRAKAGCN
jgi:hypothetical protein